MVKVYGSGRGEPLEIREVGNGKGMGMIESSGDFSKEGVIRDLQNMYDAVIGGIDGEGRDGIKLAMELKMKQAELLGYKVERKEVVQYNGKNLGELDTGRLYKMLGELGGRCGVKVIEGECVEVGDGER